MKRSPMYVSLIRQYEKVLAESKPGWFGDYILLTAVKVDYRGKDETVFYVRRCLNNQAILCSIFYPATWDGQRNAYDAALRYFRLRCGGLKGEHCFAITSLARTPLYYLGVWERHAGHESCYMGGWLIPSPKPLPSTSSLDIDDILTLQFRAKLVAKMKGESGHYAYGN